MAPLPTSTSSPSQKIFILARLGYLSRRVLECKGKPFSTWLAILVQTFGDYGATKRRKEVPSAYLSMSSPEKGSL